MSGNAEGDAAPIFRSYSVGPLPLLPALTTHTTLLPGRAHGSLEAESTCTYPTAYVYTDLCSGTWWSDWFFLSDTYHRLISLQLKLEKQQGIGTGSSSHNWTESSQFVSVLGLSVYYVWPFLWISWEIKAPMPACELILWFCKQLYKQLNPAYLTGLLIEYLQDFDLHINWLHRRPSSNFHALKERLALQYRKSILSMPKFTLNLPFVLKHRKEKKCQGL